MTESLSADEMRRIEASAHAYMALVEMGARVRLTVIYDLGCGYRLGPLTKEGKR